LLDDVSLTRGFLKTQGITKGDVVALQMMNEYQFIVLFLAITTFGAIANPIPFQMPLVVTQKVVDKNSAKLIIYGNTLSELYKQWSSTTKCINVRDVQCNEKIGMSNVTPNDYAAFYMTGGTVSFPKTVILTHRNLTRGMTNGAYGFEKVLYQSYYAIIPFFHIFGLIRGCLTPLYTGSINYLCNDFKNIMRDLPICKPTMLILTPGLVEMICFYGSKNMQLLGGSLNTIIVGGAPVSIPLLKKANALGIYTCPGYGLTESSNLISGNRFPIERANSMGHLYQHQELKIVNNELWFKGENISPGYYHDDENNKIAYEDGWFKTGDLGKYENGELFIQGRIKNLIVLPSGEKFPPEEIETIFNNFPMTKDSLVYFKQDKIVLEMFPYEIPNMPNNLRDQKIHDFFEQVNKTLPTFMRINNLIIRTEDFKRSGAMKILRNQQ
jgi:long-chain acyl-CoA synthetase